METETERQEVRAATGPLGLIWAALGAASVLAAGIAVHPAGLSALTGSGLATIGGGALVFLIGAIAILGANGARRSLPLPAALLIIGAVLSAYLLFLIVWGDYSRPAVLAVTVTVGVLWASGFASGRIRALALAGALAGAALAPTALDLVRPDEAPLPDIAAQVRVTSRMVLDVRTFEGVVPHSASSGGAVEWIGDRYLLASGDGGLYTVSIGDSPEAPPDVSELSLRVPLNRDEFEQDLIAWDAFEIDLDFGREPSWFRVTGLLAQELGDRVRILAAHHFWSRDDQCTVHRLSAIELTRDQLLGGAEAPEVSGGGWRTVFEAQPCLPLRDPTERPWTRDPLVFGGSESGGRLVALSDDEVLLSLGDQAFDGWNHDRILAQDPESDYGKVLRIEVGTGTSSIFTSGHRNPQGLHLAPDGRVWSSEHGPEGGDELNRLVEGANYGWPYVTFGTEYGSLTWPVSDEEAGGGDFQPPAHTWVPSIGISNLTTVTDSAFGAWTGNLLVTSLNTMTLWRIPIADDRVAFVEPVEIGVRIRDLAFGPPGVLLLFSDDNGGITLVRPVPEEETGAMLFAICGGCHMQDGRTGTLWGPSLDAVLGRTVASETGYDYSEALVDYGGTWTRERLDAFLADPTGVVPGTRMQFAGLADPVQRSTVIDYLERLGGR